MAACSDRARSRSCSARSASLLLVVTIVAGYIGPEDALSNFTPVFVLIIFWVGMVFASALFGDIFHALNPWRAAARAPSGCAGDARTRRSSAGGRRPWACSSSPGSSWPPGWGEQPARLATATVVYSVLTWAGMALYGVEAWTRRGEAFSVYYNLFSRLAIFEKRGRVVGVRPPLAGLPPLERPPGTVAVVVVMIGTVTFDGLSQGAIWKRHLHAACSTPSARRCPARSASSLGVGLVGGFYLLGMAGATTVGGGFDIAHAGPRVRALAGPDRRSSTSPPTTSRSCSSRARRSATRPRIRSDRAGTCSAGPTPGSTTA